jgi:hypothetical protein
MRSLKAKGRLSMRLKIREDMCFNLLKPNGNSVYHAVIHPKCLRLNSVLMSFIGSTE